MLLILPLALAGYGDQYHGYPSWSERWTFLWTNAARVAPSEFEEDYQEGGCSYDKDFSADEQTPKDPLYLDLSLTEVARLHSEDMVDNGCFQHDSCDGTDVFKRIESYYDESYNVGENIAMVPGDGRYAVLSVWMCSTAGHRAMIMNGDMNELGVGAADAGQYAYFTQDFGDGVLNEGSPPVRMAADDGSGGFYADWGDASAPVRLDVLVDGSSQPMTMVHGTAERGIYYAKASVGGCKPWWIAWEMADGTTGTFPEVGAYQAGTCSTDFLDDREAEGLADDGGTGKSSGTCSQVDGRFGWGAFGALALLARRRRGQVAS